MQRVLLFGSTGMVGNGIYRVLKDRHSLILPVRNLKKAELLETYHGGLAQHTLIPFDALSIYQEYINKKGYPSAALSLLINQVGTVDYVVNALGVIPQAHHSDAETFFLNSAFPHILSRYFGSKLIHITTDCVFNGKEGAPYSEVSLKTPNDLYGLSKMLGEPSENSLVLRTSVIGRELGTSAGLLEWFLKVGKKGIEVNGFSHHIWNGVTNIHLGSICDTIMVQPKMFPKSGTYHVFSNPLSKFKILHKFEQKYHTDSTIVENGETALNRELTTIHEFNHLLTIPPLDQMIEELP